MKRNTINQMKDNHLDDHFKLIKLNYRIDQFQQHTLHQYTLTHSHRRCLKLKTIIITNFGSNRPNIVM
jgi:hypothetical protein